MPTMQRLVSFDTDLQQIYHPRRMGQRLARPINEKLLLVLIGCVGILGCDRTASRHATNTASTKPTVASLVPAATDMIIAMGAADQLVAISNYDRERPEIQKLP